MGGGGVNDEPFPDPDERPWYIQLIALIAWITAVALMIRACQP